MLYKSKYPAVSIPDGSIPEFLFEQNPIVGHDDVPSYIDGISGRTMWVQQRHGKRNSSVIFFGDLYH